MDRFFYAKSAGRWGLNWSDYPNFGPAEFSCSHCGELKIDESFLAILQEIRNQIAKPLRITSGYRCPIHNQNVSSTGADGPHTTGRAADIGIQGSDAWALLRIAASFPEIRGIGVNQKGRARFIHLDTLPHNRPTVWSY